MDEKQIRISPASSYNDPSLNPAIRDEELELVITPTPRRLKMKAYDGKTGQCKGGFSPDYFVYTTRSATNYYVYCLSLSFAPRLFLDFDANACLIIGNPKEFVESVLSAVENKMKGWFGVGMDISYIDPVNYPIKDVDVFASKHFRYAYQREYRFIWLPPSPIQVLEHFVIEVPNIEKYCYLLDLSGNGVT